MSERNGLTLVFFTAIISGFSIFLNSFGVKGIDSSLFTFSKNVIVALLLLVTIFGFGLYAKLKKLKKKHWLQLTLIGFIGGSVPFLLFFKGLQMTTGQTGAFIHKTMFLYVTLFAVLFLKEKLTKGIFIGALLLLVGNYLMILPTFQLSIGHLYILIATLLWSVENTISKKVLEDLKGSIVGWGRMFFGSIFILLFLLFTQKVHLFFILTGAQLSWIIITSVFLYFYVITFYNGLREVSVITASCILSLGSPITTLLSAVFVGRSVTAFEGIGMLVIGLGLVFIVWLPSFIQETMVKDHRRA